MTAVLLRRSAGKDRWGAPAYGAEISLTVDAVYPRGTSEGDTVFTGLTAILPPATTEIPTPADQIDYNGLTYEVDGEVGTWTYFDGAAGFQVNLKRVV